MLYQYSGTFDDFPAYREYQEQVGVVFSSISTVGDTLVLETDAVLAMPEYIAPELVPDEVI